MALQRPTAGGAKVGGKRKGVSFLCPKKSFVLFFAHNSIFSMSKFSQKLCCSQLFCVVFFHIFFQCQLLEMNSEASRPSPPARPFWDDNKRDSDGKKTTDDPGRIA